MLNFFASYFLSYSARLVIYVYSEKNLPNFEKEKTVMEFLFGKVIGSYHQNLLKWNPTGSAFLGTTEILFWWTFQNSYYMESLQMIYKFCSSPMVTFFETWISYWWYTNQWVTVTSKYPYELRLFHKLRVIFIARVIRDAFCIQVTIYC